MTTLVSMACDIARNCEFVPLDLNVDAILGLGRRVQIALALAAAGCLANVIGLLAFRVRIKRIEAHLVAVEAALATLERIGSAAT